MRRASRKALLGCAALFLFIVCVLPGCGSATGGAPSARSGANDDVAERQEDDAAANAAADESAIRVGIAQALEPLAKHSDGTCEELTATIPQSDLQYLEDTCGLSVPQLFAHVLRDFSYAIGNIDVHQDTARATVMVRTLDVRSALEEATVRVCADPAAQEITELYLQEGDEAGHALIRRIFDVLYECLDDTDAHIQTSVELTLTRSGGVWTLTDDAERELVSALTSGLTTDLS